jgi:hypothetical protein
MMGTALSLLGVLRVSDPLGAIEAFVAARKSAFVPRCERLRDERDRPMLVLDVHPAAEPVRITWVRDDLIAIEARTGTAGPGYHAHVVELLTDAAAELGITWDAVGDESGYFESRDRRALESANLIALATSAMEALSLHEKGWRDVQLALPEGVVFEHDGLIATPLGPRDRAWLEAVAWEPRRGIDVFPWWEPGEGAATLRGAALAAMWIDVRWRPPLVAAERELLQRIDGWLEQGFALAPQDPWPWREWAEILELLGENSLRTTRVKLRAAALPPSEPIGYRRRAVTVTLSGGWSIRAPGDLAERWEAPGVWVGWDARRSIWFSSVEVEGSRDAETTLGALPPLEGEGELFVLEDGALRAVARVGTFEEEGHTLHRVLAHAAIGPHAAIGTFVLEREEDCAWALETWASLSHVEASLVQRRSGERTN